MSDEIQQTQGKNETSNSSAQNSNTGVQSQGMDKIAQARQEREAMARENERLERNLERLENLKAEAILGGGSLGGQPEKTPEQKIEEKDQNTADEIAKRYGFKK